MTNLHRTANPFRHGPGRGLLGALVIFLAQSITGPAHAQPGRAVTTVQYDNAHTGWNRDETALTVETVHPKTFGKKWSAALDGQLYGAPLYVSGVEIAGRLRDAVYVATENNLIYALDAGTGTPLWPMPYSLGAPGLQSELDGCGSVKPNIGITGTPVIDRDTGTLYAVGLTRRVTPQGIVREFKMAAVDIANGRSQPGWPVTVGPTATLPIDTLVTANRGALLLSNGIVYVPFGGYAGDCGLYYGWVVGVNATNPQAPPLYYRTPGSGDHRGSGMWAAGGLAADEEGYVYAVTGNSFFAPDIDFSNAVLKLDPDLPAEPRDFFMPSNWKYLNTEDLDLGSSAALLLPPQKGSNTPNLIFVVGKPGVGHLINRDKLGGVAGGDGTSGEGVFSAAIFNSSFNTAAYYEDPEVGPVIFASGFIQPDCDGRSGVVALSLYVDEKGNSAYYPLWCTPAMENPVAPFVTSAPGRTGILWAVDSAKGILHAFNAATGETLYDSIMVAGDALGGTQGFLHFTAVDGMVFIGNAENRLVAYGLR